MACGRFLTGSEQENNEGPGVSCQGPIYLREDQ